MDNSATRAYSVGMRDKLGKVAIGLSGGVDSAVAAYLLTKAGVEVVALTMQIWDGSIPIPDEGRSGCYGPGEPRDIESARSIANRLGIPHHVIPLAREYADEVLGYFRAEYRAGRTPNPCVRCNRTLKFGLMQDRARELGITFDILATGHYATVGQEASNGRWTLSRAVDQAKDQTYFLSRLSQLQLSRVTFPLGTLRKDEVKALARELGWADVADKPESQNFIETRDYGVLFEHGDQQPGPIRDTAGTLLGQHRGIVHYTIGQRKGLGIGGTTDPLYVLRLDACTNTVIVGRRDELYRARMTVTDLNWIALAQAPAEPLRTDIKIRQQHQAAPGLLVAGGSPGEVEVAFDEPQMSVTPGQVAVFYQGERVLGSGIIAA